MSVAVLAASNGRRHWISEQLGTERWRALCGVTVTRPRLLTADAGVTCRACADRSTGRS